MLIGNGRNLEMYLIKPHFSRHVRLIISENINYSHEHLYSAMSLKAI